MDTSNRLIRIDGSYYPVAYESHSTIMRPREMCDRCAPVVDQLYAPSAFVFDPHEDHTWTVAWRQFLVRLVPFHQYHLQYRICSPRKCTGTKKFCSGYVGSKELITLNLVIRSLSSYFPFIFYRVGQVRKSRLRGTLLDQKPLIRVEFWVS